MYNFLLLDLEREKKFFKIWKYIQFEIIFLF
jgi:hypothetical protein